MRQSQVPDYVIKGLTIMNLQLAYLFPFHSFALRLFIENPVRNNKWDKLVSMRRLRSLHWHPFIGNSSFWVLSLISTCESRGSNSTSKHHFPHEKLWLFVSDVFSELCIGRMETQPSLPHDSAAPACWSLALFHLNSSINPLVSELFSILATILLIHQPLNYSLTHTRPYNLCSSQTQLSYRTCAYCNFTNSQAMHLIQMACVGWSAGGYEWLCHGQK